MFQTNSPIAGIYKYIRQLVHLPLAAVGITQHNCRFSPTCSEYCEQAVKKNGFFKGGIQCVNRIWRCRPGIPGGYDPV